MAGMGHGGMEMGGLDQQEAMDQLMKLDGEAFDKGETFSGVDFEVALEAVDELKKLVPGGMTLAQFALRWILMFPEVSCAIPGAKTPQQAQQNASSANFPALSASAMAQARAIYDSRIRGLVENRW